MNRRDILVTTGAAALLAACQQNTAPPSGQRVRAEDHDAFWLWAGVAPPAVLDRAKTIYLLGGEIGADGRWMVRRPVTPAVDHAEVWLVVRVETLAWNADHFTKVVALTDRWERSNSRFAGLQIDFDAATKQLDRYGEFLRDLRQRLPKQYRLGVTGLLDWSAQGDPKHLAALGHSIDEAVFQIYQGRNTIPGYQDWLARLDALPMPFRIGIVEGGEWQEPADLTSIANYRGTVVFLLNNSLD